MTNAEREEYTREEVLQLVLCDKQAYDLLNTVDQLFEAERHEGEPRPFGLAVSTADSTTLELYIQEPAPTQETPTTTLPLFNRIRRSMFLGNSGGNTTSRHYSHNAQLSYPQEQILFSRLSYLGRPRRVALTCATKEHVMLNLSQLSALAAEIQDIIRDGTVVSLESLALSKQLGPSDVIIGAEAQQFYEATVAALPALNPDTLEPGKRLELGLYDGLPHLPGIDAAARRRDLAFQRGRAICRTLLANSGRRQRRR